LTQFLIKRACEEGLAQLHSSALLMCATRAPSHSPTPWSPVDAQQRRGRRNLCEHACLSSKILSISGTMQALNGAPPSPFSPHACSPPMLSRRALPARQPRRPPPAARRHPASPRPASSASQSTRRAGLTHPPPPPPPQARCSCPGSRGTRPTPSRARPAAAAAARGRARARPPPAASGPRRPENSRPAAAAAAAAGEPAAAEAAGEPAPPRRQVGSRPPGGGPHRRHPRAVVRAGRPQKRRPGKRRVRGSAGGPARPADRYGRGPFRPGGRFLPVPPPPPRCVAPGQKTSSEP
jgi:hypothetical protein